MKKIIIDCDPGIDDSLAIMLALNSPETELLGLTIVAGNSPADMGAGNALKVLRFMGRPDIPVYVGATAPMKREYVNALDTHGADGLGESFLPEVTDIKIQEPDAITFLKETLLASPGEITVIALGPMTNLAGLYMESPKAFGSIKEIVSMGGNFRSHGNCSPVAEYNYWEDPDSAKVVFNALYDHAKEHHGSAPKLTIVGLDVTRKIVLTPTILSYMERMNPTVGDFVRKITKFYLDFHWEWEHIIGCVINDPLAVAYFLEPSIGEGFDAYTDIETQGISLGQSVVDSMGFYQKPANAHILTSVDVNRFWIIFLSRLLGKNENEIDLRLW